MCCPCRWIFVCLAVAGLARAETGGVVNITEGSSVTLPCELPTGEDLPPKAQLVWSREGVSQGAPETLGTYLAGPVFAALATEHKILDHSNSRHVQFAANDSGTDDSGIVLRFPLHLQRVTVTEDRRYDCRTTGTTTGRNVSTYIVNVLGPPRDLHLSMNFTVVDEGEKVRLACKAAGKPAPRYVWLDKEGRELPSEHGVAHFIATLDVAGSISCKAYNEHGETQVAASIVVNFKPKVEVHDYVAFRPGLPLHLACRYASIPEAIAVWLKDGTAVGSSRGFSVEKTTLPAKNAWQLVIRKDRAAPEDAGVYVCQANNSLGSSASNTIVTDRPYGTIMDTKAIGDTWARLLLTTNSAVKVKFCLNVTALNSSLLVDRWTLYVPGEWHASHPAAAAEHQVEHVIARKVQNDFNLELKPATHYRIELKVLTDAEFIVSPTNEQLLDVDADFVEVSARVDIVTREGSPASYGSRDSNAQESASSGDKQHEARHTLTNSAVSNLATPCSPATAASLVLLLVFGFGGGSR